MGNYKRQHYFINKELQGKYMVSFAVPMLTLLLFFAILGYLTLMKGVDTATSNIVTTIDNQTAFSLQGKANPTVEDYKNLLSEIRNSISDYNNNKGHHEIIKQLLLYIIVPGMVLLMIQVLLLTIFFSHKLAGPIYRIQLGMERVISGDFTERIRLRQGDQLQALADKFNGVMDKVSETVTELSEENDEKAKKEIVKKVKL